MRRSSSILLGLLVVVVFSTQALGERRRRPPSPPPEPEVPTSVQISDDMGEIRWGWGHKQLLDHYTKEMRKLYRPLLAKAGGAIEEERLRRQMEARIGRITKSFVEFTGQRSGWDSSLVRDQYTHGNGEALVEVRELRAGGGAHRYTDYFFFINDALWRRYRAFNQDQFAGLSFEEAAGVFERRYGKARPVYSTDAAAESKVLSGLEWRDETTSLKAIDNTHFYGVLCLVYSDRATEGRIDSLRTNRPETKSRISSIVKALDSVGEDDVHANIVEHITGKRYKTAQPQEGVKSRGSGTPPATKSKSGGTIFDEPPPPSKRTGSRDLLEDLDI